MRFTCFPNRRFLSVLTLSGLLAACSPEPSPQAPSPTPTPIPQTQEQAVVHPELWPQASSPVGGDEAVESRVESLLAKMSLAEKVGQMMQAEIQSLEPGDVKKYHLGSVLNGGGSWPHRKENATVADWLALADQFYDESMDDSDGYVAIPVIWGTDAVHGHNNVIGATLFPQNIALGATRDPQLVRDIGAATAKAVRATGIDWAFAPTIAVARNYGWGRTYESYSEDPALVAQFSGEIVKGLQGEPGTDEFLSNEHVLASAKHFLGDGGTWQGDDQGDTRVSERELIDVHSAGYPPAINAGVQTVMSSFSSWQGEKMHGNKDLLTRVLKERMGFDGLVVGDWNGHGQVAGCTVSSCAQAINAGIDLVMVPNDWKALIKNTIAQVESGEISEARIDDAVRRILRVKVRTGIFEGRPSARALDASVLGSDAHRALARKAVRESLVLLKNQNHILPLLPQQRVMVVGPAAKDIGWQSGGWTITWQGTGNTNDKFPGATSIYEGIKRAVTAGDGTVTYSVDGSVSGGAKPDVAIAVFGERPYAEGVGDVASLELEPGDKPSLAMLQRLREQGIPVVSVFLSGRPMWVNPELNASDAFVAAWWPGSEGDGVADVLFADGSGQPRFHFNGRLSFSWPKTPLQTELNIGSDDYDPLFPLGYGLDYSNGQQGPDSNLPVDLDGVDTGELKDIDFYVGGPMQPWSLFVSHNDSRQVLSGAFAALSDKSVQVETADKDVQEDALDIRWKDANGARLYLQDGQPLDLTPYLENGTLAFDMKVDKLAKGGLTVGLDCGENCKREVPLNEIARSVAGKDWQHYELPLSCFVREGDDLSSVATPFSMELGGSGRMSLANVRFMLKGSANTQCPDITTVALEPAKLTEWWALDWWEPRHQQVLKRIAEGEVDLLMIGDSITHGWENEGKPVWDEYYAKRNAVNLGFSGDRTENVLWRLEHGEIDGISPKLAVLMIGTNNTGHRLQPAQYTAQGIAKIVETLRTKLPETKVLVLGVFPRDAKPDAPMRLINRDINKRIEKLADGKNVFFLDIGDTFLNDDGVLTREVAPDLLHLNTDSYRLWAQAMEPTLKKLLGEA